MLKRIYVSAWNHTSEQDEDDKLDDMLNAGATVIATAPYNNGQSGYTILLHCPDDAETMARKWMKTQNVVWVVAIGESRKKFTNYDSAVALYPDINYRNMRHNAPFGFSADCDYELYSVIPYIGDNPAENVWNAVSV